MLKSLINILSDFKKSTIFFILILIIIGSIFEILSLGVIIPLISFLLENKENNPLIIKFKSFFPFIDFRDNVLFYVMSFILIVFYLRFIFLTFMTLTINKFIFNSQKKISEKLLSIYLNKNYSWHSENNKSRFINLMTNEVINFCSNGLYGFLFVTSEIFFFLSIVIFLLIWKTQVFFIILGVSVIFFPALIIFTRKVTYKLGVTRQSTESSILMTINENLAGIKEMILYNWDKNVKKNYSELAENLVKVSAKHNSMQDISRYLIEIFGVTLVVLFIVTLSFSTQSSDNLVTLTVFGAALFRLMPILNRISTFSQRLKFGLASSIKINEFYENKENYNIEKYDDIIFDRKLIFKNISFKFKGKKDFILKNLNLELNRGEILGIYGESGVGKTTLSNILMGLIEPSSGQILVDEIDLIKNKKTLKRNIAFVPQNFFYADTTLLNNITFYERKINFKNLKDAIKNSLLLKSILNKSLSLKTNIGNNALKISGGQLQRIGLARALYRKPKILILDEPTSSLDKINQDKFKEIVLNLKKQTTIVIISHDKDMLSVCDKLINLEKKI